jgi:hypothetical protein
MTDLALGWAKWAKHEGVAHTEPMSAPQITAQ